MSNPYVSFTWVDRISEFPTRRKLTDTTTQEEKQYYVSRDEGDVTVQGTPFAAQYMNSLESRINAAFAVVPETLSGTTAPTVTDGKNGDTYYMTETDEHDVVTVAAVYVKIAGAWLEVATGGAALPQAEGGGF